VVSAVVCRGGRPDLAPAALPLVRCAVLLIVGDRDREVLRLNQRAAQALKGPHRLALVAGAGHLFEEPGTLTAMTTLALQWFRGHLPEPQGPGGGGTSHFHTAP
jgi:pimeloyl-ACP methyl ester carboxylesterase